VGGGGTTSEGRGERDSVRGLGLEMMKGLIGIYLIQHPLVLLIP